MTFFSAFFRRKEAQPPKAAEENVFRVLAEQASDALFHIGADGLVTYASPSVERMLGYRPEQVVGTDTLWFMFEADRPALVDAIVRLRSGEDAQLRHQARALRADGSIIWAEGSAVVSQDGTRSIILVLRDIDDRKRVEEELAVFALQDGLTGLANRRSFDQTLDREWRRTLRETSQLSLLLLDLDHFKQFNDAQGHQAGDDCLRSVAAATQSGLSRAGDLACRYGGEELAVILSGTDADGAMDVAERIRSAIEALRIPHQGNGGMPFVTVSIGVATALARVGGTMRMPEGLLQAADHALYRAKSEGRNRVATALLFAPGSET